jgi:TDG/mug DNA glycosylase family protein
MLAMVPPSVGPTILRLPRTRIHSFRPIAAKDARILVLGSMPGAESLAQGRYYAHRHNSFWPIMAALFDFDPAAPYAARVRALRARRVAVWDVLQSCVREGSLDTSIEAEVPNDFAAFFGAHRAITHVFFNGAKAEACYRRHVGPEAGGPRRTTRLPSTSPAHAALSMARKLIAWRAILKAKDRP